MPINKCAICPYCSSANVSFVDNSLYHCEACGRQITIVDMKKNDFKEADNLNKVLSDDLVTELSDEMQEAYKAMQENVAEGYDNVEATGGFDMLNE